MTNLPIWNLADFYPNYKSKLIKDDLESLRKDSESFLKKYKNKLKHLDKSKLLKSIEDYEQLEEKIYFIKSFSFLTHCTDQLNKDKNKFYQNTEEIISDIEKNIIFYGIEFNKIDKKKICQLKSSKYSNWIENLNKFKKYQQTEKIEKVLMEKSITSSSAWIKFFDQSMTRLRFLFRNKELSETEILNLFSSSDQKIRKDAAISFGKTLSENIFNFTFIMNNISKDLDIDMKLRGFKFSESSRHLSNQIDKEDVDSLVKTVKGNYRNICHRYYNYKAKYFGQKKLNFWDRNAPYPGRKKDLIVTSGGDNISVQKIENILTEQVGIDQAVILGDNKPYLVALLYSEEKLDDSKIKLILRFSNSKLNSVEKIRKYILLNKPLTYEDGFLTQTQKIKKREVYKFFRDKIESLY